MAQCLFRSFPNNVTRVAISSYKNVDYDVKPAKMHFLSHENLLVHPLLLPVSSQREQTIVPCKKQVPVAFQEYRLSIDTEQESYQEMVKNHLASIDSPANPDEVIENISGVDKLHIRNYVKRLNGREMKALSLVKAYRNDLAELKQQYEENDLKYQQ